MRHGFAIDALDFHLVAVDDCWSHRDKVNRMTDWKIGMIVEFGRTHGEKTQGVIVKVNPKKLKVKQIGTRGRQKSHREGTVWTVPRSLCKVIEDGVNTINATMTSTPRPQTNQFEGKTESELLDIIEGIDCQLSPENISCDGEASARFIRRRSAELMRDRAKAELALGRNVPMWF